MLNTNWRQYLPLNCHGIFEISEKCPIPKAAQIVVGISGYARSQILNNYSNTDYEHANNTNKNSF